VLGRSILQFDLKLSRVDRQQLATFGDVRTPGIADLFVAMLADKPGGKPGDKTGNRPSNQAEDTRDSYEGAAQ
jgi:hypothetical protein